MEYRFSKDPLFGKYCYIDTPWIAGKNTIYRIVNSGVRSNAWVEVPISGRAEVVLHDYQEDVVFVVLDTLISEDSRIKKVALKDVEIADTPQTDRIKTPDYCGICNHKGCDNCIANSLDDYCVPSGYEPITKTETENSNLTFEKRTMLDCYNCKRYKSDDACVECRYEPKADTPQTEGGAKDDTI